MVKLNKSGEFNSLKLAKGVYAALGTITEITDLSNHPKDAAPINLRNDGTPLEICIDVEYERDDGARWNTRFWGNYKKDKVTGNIIGWDGFNNGVQNFFETILGDLESVGKLINDDWSMTKELFEEVIGTEFYRVSYVSGMKEGTAKAKYKDWNRIFLKDATVEEMQEAWARVSIKMKSYTPDVIDEVEAARETENTDFNYGANATDAATDKSEEFEL